MSRRLVLRPQAEREIFEAAEWYESRGRGLAGEFLRTIDATIGSLLRNPLQYPLVHLEMRRALLRRFPYAVIFSVSDEEIVILSCAPNRQNPERWQSRR